MRKRLKRFLSNWIGSEIIDRINNLKKPILAWTISCIIDLFVIYLASYIFSKITGSIEYKEIILISFIFICVIILRIYLVINLRKYASNLIYKNKNTEELILVKNYVKNKIYSDEQDDESIESFKESVINATFNAASRFDVPVVAGTAEVLFASLGLIYLLFILGPIIFIINIPFIIILFFCSSSNARILFDLGKVILSATEKKLLSIDNINEVSYELSALKKTTPLLKIFDSKNKILNRSLTKELVTITSLQTLIESLALLIILFSMISINLGFSTNSLEDAATSLALLSRIIPSITRCIAYYSQIQFGISPVKKLWKIKK